MAERDGLAAVVEELRGALKRLEDRVARLEESRAPSAEVSGAADEVARAAADEQTTHGFLAGAAMVCFALVGALLLRTLARQGLLPAQLGPALGLLYCGLLLLVPWLRQRTPHGPLLQACGGLLVPLVVLETVHRGGALSAGTATLVLGAFLVGGSLLAATRRVGWLAGVLVLAQVAAVAGLGLGAPHAAWRAATLAGATGLALILAHRLGWAWLRPVVLLPVGGILTLGLLASARRPELQSVAQATLGGATVAWLAFGATFALRRSVVDRFEQALLPWATLWLLALASFTDPALGLRAGAGLGALALGIVFLATRRGAAPWSTSLLVTGLCLCGASLPLAEPRGLGLAVAGLLGLYLAQRTTRTLPLLLAVALPLEGVAVALTRGGLAEPHASVALGVLLSGLLVSAVAIALRGVDDRALSRRGAGLLAVGAGVALFASFHSLGLRWAGPGELSTLLDTVVLGLLALATLVTGRALRQPVLRLTGLAAMAALGAKVLLRDLPALGGGYLVASILFAGVSALVASLVLRNNLKANPGD